MIDQLLTVLGKVALDASGEMGKQIGAEAARISREMLDKVFEWMKGNPTRETIANQFPLDPETWAAPMKSELTKLVAENQQIKNELDRLVKGFDQAVNDYAGPSTEIAQAFFIGSGAIAQGSSPAAGEKGAAIDGNARDVFTGDGAMKAQEIKVFQGTTIITGDQPEVPMPQVDRASALGKYLQHVISRNRYLQLQGIRSGGKLVHIELDRIFIRLRARRSDAEPAAIEEMDPSRPRRFSGTMEEEAMKEASQEPPSFSIEDGMAKSDRLVVLGDPGSGKTTLLRYLAHVYGRSLAEDRNLVKEMLGLDEGGRLPIMLAARQIGAYLHKIHEADESLDGHALIIRLLLDSLKEERIVLPDDFFDEFLEKGDAVVLLDGLDELADPDLRRRVARLIEGFARACPKCRFVVTSRIVGYTGAARLGESFEAATVREFTDDDVREFLSRWHLLIAVGLMGPGPSAEIHAEDQTRKLVAAIEANERIRDLAVNPLMLTVIAVVHRDRVKLPDRRAELYAEAVDVLLGKWDEAKGVKETPIFEDRPFDTGDRRLVLQELALRMHEQRKKEIDLSDLREFLIAAFRDGDSDGKKASHSADRFLNVIEERAGLLTSRGDGQYSFSHLTFQEYLASLAIAARDDYIQYTLGKVDDDWWREVILLEAGHLSMQGKGKTRRLIQTIADRKEEKELHHNLVLAAECLRDVGKNRVDGTLEAEVIERLRAELERPAPCGGWLGGLRTYIQCGMTPKGLVERKIAAARALGRIHAGLYWKSLYEEPEWVEIPAGEFWLGEEAFRDAPPHRLHLDAFHIAKTPITNAQFTLFVEDSRCDPPAHWEGKRPPKGLENHPVVGVSWHDAMDYCRWLSEKIDKKVILPSEAEWEKAARGVNDQRAYPWGDDFDASRCNCWELGLRDTTPVGIFLNGVSPYGCLDMAGNEWEWTRSLWGKDVSEPEFEYPYNPEDGREDLTAFDTIRRVLRGGAFSSSSDLARCSSRLRVSPSRRYLDFGFRVALSPYL